MSSFFLAYMLLHSIDYRQTTYAMSHPDQYHEANPLLGKHPSRATLNKVFIGSSVAMYYLDKHCDCDIAKGVAIGLTFTNIARNMIVVKRF